MEKKSDDKKHIMDDIESELFNKYDNLKFQILADIINNDAYRNDLEEVYHGQRIKNMSIKNMDDERIRQLSEKEITNYIITKICNAKYGLNMVASPKPDPDFLDFIRGKKNDDAFFDEEENKFIFNIDRLPVVLNIHEQEFIKLMLSDHEARCLMSDELIEKLEKKLEHIDVSYITDNYTTLFRTKRNYDYSKLKTIISTVMIAINEHWTVKSIYITAAGERKESLICPYKILYSLRKDSFQIISWLEEGERVICQNMDGYESFTLKDKLGLNDVNRIEGFIEKRKCFVTLTIQEDEDKKRKAFERCILTFADYEREVYYRTDGDDEEPGRKSNGKYTIFLFYFDFDTNELVDDIVALGSAVVVEECTDEKINKVVSTNSTNKTKEVRRLVIEKIKASLKSLEMFD